MTWFIGLDSVCAVEDTDAATEEEAIEQARLTLLGWLQQHDKPHIYLVWSVEHE